MHKPLKLGMGTTAENLLQKSDWGGGISGHVERTVALVGLALGSGHTTAAEYK